MLDGIVVATVVALPLLCIYRAAKGVTRPSGIHRRPVGVEVECALNHRRAGVCICRLIVELIRCAGWPPEVGVGVARGSALAVGVTTGKHDSPRAVVRCRCR